MKKNFILLLVTITSITFCKKSTNPQNNNTEKILFLKVNTIIDPVPGDGYLYIMNIDGTNQVRLTNNSGVDGWVNFKP